jgi:hypothetical protein
MRSPDEKMDRRAVVTRHAVTVTGIDHGSALSVGNGELCMTVDVTGLQTFPEQYPVGDGTLLGTLSQWGWHSTPRPPGAELTLRPYQTSRGEVPYADSPPMTGADDSAVDERTRWLRANPHRLDLGRIGLVWLAGLRSPIPAELGACRQVLDLWTGVITSELTLGGHRLTVTTACHPSVDAVAVSVDAPPGVFGVRLAFPYGSTVWHDAADWSNPGAHATEIEPAAGGVVVRRYFDGATEATYRLRVRGEEVRRTGPHELVVAADRVAVSFARGDPSDVDVGEVLAASRVHWPRFWASGAALDLAGSTDPRAPELERRAVLSQYLTAIQCAGSLPPQETGLTTNSWRGRFHLEMHWWHAAHFALWGRPALLARSMSFYQTLLPRARTTAAIQGYAGARWPKQIGPDGRESPSHIGPFLLWQQPHPIHLAELLRRAGVDGHDEVVEQTAHFMADVVEPGPDGFGLGPPLVPAQESYADIRDRVRDPPFELAYWAWALEVAQEWRVRAGKPPEPKWDEVRKGLVRPLIRDGRYTAIGVDPFTVRTDHPSLVYALGPVPATDLVDRSVLVETLHDVLADWDWPNTWGWDYPALAMTATRLGEPSTAVDVLLRDSDKNTYLHNGHNRQTGTLPVYLPGNGGLLAALALMVAGWDGAGPCPGFPAEGWSVRHEGFVRSP